MPEITFTAPAGSLSGYVAEPETGGRWPGVVVLQDVRGITADLRSVADRLAAAGYLALVPDLYGRGLKITCMVATIRAHFAERGHTFDDIIAARDHLVADPRCTGKIGLIGFCMGAGFVLQLSPSGHFDAAASNYGLSPKTLDTLARSCPLVASYGAKDRIVPAGSAHQIEAVLAKAAVPHDIKEYPGVGHAFMNKAPAPLRVITDLAGMKYSEPEAEDSWRRILTFFSEHLTD